MRKFSLERSEDEFCTSHAGLALVGLGVASSVFLGLEPVDDGLKTTAMQAWSIEGKGIKLFR